MAAKLLALFAILFSFESFAQVYIPQTQTDLLTVRQLSATPVTPSASYFSIYPKADGNLYFINPLGTESLLVSNVLGTVLSGFSASPSSAVTSSDTVLSGFGKLQAEVNTANASFANYQSIITATNLNQYYRGDKTFVDFEPAVRAASLLGLSVSAQGASIAPTDSTLSAFGKLQAEINNSAASITTLTTSDAGKEPAIASGTATQVWHGNKTWSQILDQDVSSSAAISYAKLNLANAIMNSDIAPSASIGRTKIAGGTINQVVLNDSSGLLTSVSYNGTANLILPSQTGQSGKYLTTDGNNTSWGIPAGGGGTGTLLAHYWINAADVSINASSYTTVNYDTQDTAVTVTGGSVTTGAGTWRFTANQTEGLLVCISYRWQGNSVSNADYLFKLAKNNVANTNVMLDYLSGNSGGVNQAPGGYGCDFVSAVNGDIIQVWAYQTAVNPLKLFATENSILIFKVY